MMKPPTKADINAMQIMRADIEVKIARRRQIEDELAALIEECKAKLAESKLDTEHMVQLLAEIERQIQVPGGSTAGLPLTA